MSANSKGTAKRKVRGKPWPKGVSGNPKGAPKRGESWAEVIRAVGDFTPVEAADYCYALGKQYASLGGSVTLKQLAVLRTFLSLISEPSASLLRLLIEHSDGPAPSLPDGWRDEVKAMGIDPRDLFEEAVELIMRKQSGETLALPVVREVIIETRREGDNGTA